MRWFIFMIATICKAIEPLAVAYSKSKAGLYPYNLLFAMVVTETVKVSFCGCFILVQSCFRRPTQPCMRHSGTVRASLRFVVPAVLLAAVNQCMFIGLLVLKCNLVSGERNLWYQWLGLAYLGPVLYQVRLLFWGMQSIVHPLLLTLLMFWFAL